MTIIGKLSVPATRGDVASLHQYRGSGFPEGKVTAPVGAVYTDTSATHGAIRWIKTTGTGATGWQVEYGDTGWRNITAAAVGGTASDIAVARIGQMVTVSAASFRPATTGTVGVVDLPSGFRSTKNSSGSAVESNTVRPVFALRYSPYRVQVRNVGTVNSYVDFTITFITNDPWPTTLPGTPS